MLVRVQVSSTKTSRRGSMRAMAVERAPRGIRVNAVAPGPVDTPMAQRWHDAATRSEWIRNVPLRRYGSVGEIAGAVLFLLDPAKSSYVTGQVLAADGGFTIAGLLQP